MKRPPAGLKRFRGVAMGFALGFLVGSAGVASAAFGRQGWDRFGLLFKQGYVAGFIDCVRIAKAIDPFSYIATNFPAPPRAKPIVWVRTIDDLYAKDEHKDRTLAQILIIAGAKLEKDFGDDQARPGDQRLEHLRQAIDRQRKALLQARKTVEAAQGEINANEAKQAEDANKAAADAQPGSAAPTNADDKAATEKSDDDHPAVEPHVEQAPPTPEGLRRDIVPEGSHGEGMMPEGSHPDVPLKPQAEAEGPAEDTGEGQE